MFRIEYGRDEMQEAVFKVLGIISEEFEKKVSEINRLKLGQSILKEGLILNNTSVHLHKRSIQFDNYR